MVHAVAGYGNIMNRVIESSAGPVPEVGMGATMVLWSDRYAGTITKVYTNRAGEVTAFDYQEDTATRTDKNGMSETQHYEYAPNPEGRTAKVSRRKNGLWVKVGESARSGLRFAVGRRERYHDFGF